jgi:hypothetical protein
MALLRVYSDTSVFGGVFDDEFKTASSSFFGLVQRGRFELLVSDVTRAEIDDAPAQVKVLFDSLLGRMILIAVDDQVLSLRDAYVAAGVVGHRWLDDAAHVAAASVVQADLIVSWNFRHIVHFDKIRLYNEVNIKQGYRVIDIRSPMEVVDYEDEESL